MAKKYILAFFILSLLQVITFAQRIESKPEYYYRSGLELYRAQQYITAQEQFRLASHILELGDSFLREDIEYYLAACEAELGGENAEIMLVDFLNKYPNTRYGNDIRFTLGNLYQSRQDFVRAREQYSLINSNILSSAERMQLFFNEGYAAFTGGDYADASLNFRRVAGHDRVLGPSATYYLAYIDYSQDNLDEAERGFRSLYSDRSYGPVVPFYLLHIDFKRGDYPKVAGEVDGILSQSAGDRRGEMLKIAAEANYHLGNYEKTLAYMDAYSSEGFPMNREELYMAGYSAYMIGDFETAVDYLGKVAVGDDLLAQNASFHIGNASLRSGNKQRAQQAFALAMRIDGDKTVKQEAMFNFAKLQYELGNGMFNEIITTINNYLSEFPDSPNADEARSYLTAAYANSNNYKEAYDAISQISNPNNDEKAALQRIAYFRGLEYFTDGDYLNAQRMFDVANENRFMPKYTALTKFWLAETYYRQGLYARAILLYQDYIVLSPKDEAENIMANYNLGYSYFNLKNYRDALLWFERFIDAYPGTTGIKADAYNRIGDIYFLNRDYTQATQYYDRSIALGTQEQYYAEYQKALALGLTSGAQAKIEALKEISQAGLGDYVDMALYELGSTYTKQDMFSEAIQTLNRFVERYPRSPYYPDALLELGLAYYNAGRSSEALASYKKIAAEYPSSSQAKDALLAIRNIYVENNDLNGYFDYANNNNIETNVSVVERDSLTFTVAERIYLQGDSKRAYPLFEKYLEQYPRGNYVPNATYYISETAFNDGDADLALRGFESIINMPVNTFTINSVENAAKIYYQKENYEKSADLYRRLVETASNRTVIIDGLAGYLRSVDKLGNPDASAEAADFVLGSVFVNPDLRTEANFVKGKAYYNKGDNTDALPLLKDAGANPETRNGAEAQYLVIEILYSGGHLEEAENEIFKLSERGTSHQFWMAKAFLVLGDIYVDKGDAFQAKATYQSIIDGYTNRGDGIIAEAESKLKQLNENDNNE
ncbi:MAG: tetratricopeptide repeat protein [Rikenellaceae bacterium]|nr:tetratricopeptide repeat protein [Rikenellaceae bacterium]